MASSHLHKINSWQEKGFFSKVSRAGTAPLPCENHARMCAKTGKKHLIGQTELYAVVLARKVWASYINNCRCIFFIDHAGVMSACIKGIMPKIHRGEHCC